MIWDLCLLADAIGREWRKERRFTGWGVQEQPQK